MLRLACLLLSLSGAPAICAADGAAVAAAPEAAGPTRCEAKPADTAASAVAEASPSDAPTRRTEAASARPGASTGARVRTANPRWHRLLPGMFR